MKFTSINILGNLLSEEVLNNIEAGLSKGQTPADFGFDSSTSVKEEVEYAWSRMKLDWKHFIEKTNNLPANDPYGTSLSRKWMEQFLSTLGYQLTRQKSTLEGNNNQTYSISHAEESLDKLPVHIVGFLEPDNPGKNTLDIRTSGGTTRMSAHATVQEYLNVTEHLYGIVTNGFTLRLIRDSGRLIRLNYIEIDLKRLLDEDKYSEFNIIYRLLHATRLPKTSTAGESSFIENYYQESLASGNRIRDELSKAVKISLHSLANGFLKHPSNDALREAIQTGRLTAFDYNHSLLRLIYRLLFLMVTEERDLLFAEDSEKISKCRTIYNQFYSIGRLRKLSAIRHLSEPQYSDLWQGLLYNFKLFEPGGNGPKLGIAPLGGELFSEEALGYLNDSHLSNQILLDCIRSLNEFEDKGKIKMFVNYRALDVEELGSIYEGLLELEPEIIQSPQGPEFNYTKGTGRSSSGSHYTPEDLVKPLIKHSLEYLIEDRATPFYKGKENKEKTIEKLLDLKICDVACGSGHILLSAARRLAMEVARIESGEQQPNPTSFRMALRKVIQQCIYGVDKNPLAVELCKVSLWLEAHVPGSPLNFLDHHIKCGDAIVGLAHREELENGIADEAFKTLPGDDKEIAAAIRKRNQNERKLKLGTLDFDKEISEEVNAVLEKFNIFKNLPENSPEEVAKKEKEYRKFENTVERIRLKQLADAQVTQFFIPKTEQNKSYLLTDSEYRAFLKNVNKGMGPIQSQKLAYAESVQMKNKFFHWFLEFPEVFQNGGFDCILGNPPFLGGKRISTNFGDNYLNFIKFNFEPIKGATCDLVAYFFRRNFGILSPNRFLSLISTNTIAQGETREGSLEIIEKHGGTINHAIKSMKWPGLAAVDIAIVSIYKGIWEKDKIINGTNVNHITTFLDDSISNLNPYKLIENDSKSFKGTYVLGLGFTLSDTEAQDLKIKNPENKKIIFPYINGDDINNDVRQMPSRHIINFYDWDMLKCKHEFPECFELIEKNVKPERIILKDKGYREKWWQYARRGVELYENLKTHKNYFISCTVTKHLSIVPYKGNLVFDIATNVMLYDSNFYFSIFQSNIHECWARKYGSTLETRLRYTPTDCIQNFPLPQNYIEKNELPLKTLGSRYHEHRKQLMLDIQLGLTKTYNLFHDPMVNSEWFKFGDDKKKASKNMESLIKHLAKTPGTITLEEAVDGIEKLRALHVEMDLAVLDAYGWSDLQLRHDFYEVDYLPENDRTRFTIQPDARKEVLKRLLELNHKIHEEEVAAGLWDKKKAGGKKTKKENKVEEPKGQYGLFGEETSEE